MVKRFVLLGVIAFFCLIPAGFSVSFSPDRAFVVENEVQANYSLYNNFSSLQLFWKGGLAFDYLLSPSSQAVLSYWVQWHVEYWKTVGQGSWAEVIPTSVAFSIENQSPSSVVVWRNSTLGDGSTLKVKYVLKAGSPLKYEVFLTANQNKQYRLIWRVDSPPSVNKRGNGKVELGFSPTHYFDFGDLYNVTVPDGNGTKQAPYYDLSEDISPPARYRLFVNVSLNGVPLSVGQTVSFDPSITILPYYISSNSTAYDLTGNLSGAFASGNALAFYQNVSASNLTSNPYYFLVNSTGGQMGFNVSGQNQTLQNLSVINGFHKVQSGFAHAISISGAYSANYSGNLTIVGLNYNGYTSSGAGNTSSAGDCDSTYRFALGVCSNVTFLQLNDSVFNQTNIVAENSVLLYGSINEYGFPTRFEIWNSSFYQNTTLTGGAYTSRLFHARGGATAGANKGSLKIFNSQFYQVGQAGVGSWSANHTLYILNYDAWVQSTNVSNGISGGYDYWLYKSNLTSINSSDEPLLAFEDTASYYIQGWLADLRAETPGGTAISGATIQAFDSRNYQVVSCTTNSTGYCDRVNLTEFFRNSTARVVPSLHNFTVAKGTEWNQTQVNITGNQLPLRLNLDLLSFNQQGFDTANQSEYSGVETVRFYGNFSNSTPFDTVYFQWNGTTNYTATQLNCTDSSAYFYYDLTGASALNHSVSWWANDTGGSYAQGGNSTWGLVANTSQNAVLTIDGLRASKQITYGTPVNASLSCSEGNAKLYRNTALPTLVGNSGTLFSSELSPILPGGINNYTGECLESTNFTTSNSSSFNVEVQTEGEESPGGGTGGGAGGGGGGSPISQAVETVKQTVAKINVSLIGWFFLFLAVGVLFLRRSGAI